MNKTSLCEHEHDRATCVGTRKFYRISHTIFRLRNAKLSHTQTLWHIEYRRVLVLHTYHRSRCTDEGISQWHRRPRSRRPVPARLC